MHCKNKVPRKKIELKVIIRKRGSNLDTRVRGISFGNATINTSVRVGRNSDSTERSVSLSPLVLILSPPPLLLSSLTTSLTRSSLFLLRTCWSALSSSFFPHTTTFSHNLAACADSPLLPSHHRALHVSTREEDDGGGFDKVGGTWMWI